jgi:hypothetical protein
MAQETTLVDGSARVTPIIVLCALPATLVSIVCIKRYLLFKKGEGQVKSFCSVEETGELISGSVWQEQSKKISIKRDNLFIGDPERRKD